MTFDRTTYDPSLSRVEAAVVAFVGAMAAGLFASAAGLAVVYTQTQVAPLPIVAAVAVFGAGVLVSAVAGVRLLARHYGSPDRPVRIAGRPTGESDESPTRD